MGGGESVGPSQSPETQIRYQFESLCKKVIVGQRNDYLRELSRRKNSEVCLSDLPPECIDRLCSYEEDPAAYYTFYINGYVIQIQNDRLARSLLSLGTEGYEILLMAYALKMNDREIASILGVSRSKIQHDRSKLLAALQEEMRK